MSNDCPPEHFVPNRLLTLEKPNPKWKLPLFSLLTSAVSAPNRFGVRPTLMSATSLQLALFLVPARKKEMEVLATLPEMFQIPGAGFKVLLSSFYGREASEKSVSTFRSWNSSQFGSKL